MTVHLAFGVGNADGAVLALPASAVTSTNTTMIAEMKLSLCTMSPLFLYNHI
jgi:hypothetical protein